MQHLLRIIQPLFELRTERLSGQLRRNGNFSRGRIRRRKFHFINLDRRMLVVAKCFLELLGEVLRLGSTHRESGDQTGKVVERDLGGKVNARQAGRRQQLREAAFRLSRFQRGAVQQKPIVRNSQQEAGLSGLGQPFLQLFPCYLELAFGPLVSYPVQPRVLYKDIKAVDKCPGRRIADSIVLGNRGDDFPLKTMELRTPAYDGK